jgi:hypothetical protein
MTFMIEVSITLFEEIFNADENTKTVNSLIRNMKYDLTFSKEFNTNTYTDLFEVLSFTCPYCSHMERVGQYYIV